MYSFNWQYTQLVISDTYGKNKTSEKTSDKLLQTIKTQENKEELEILDSKAQTYQERGSEAIRNPPLD